MLHKNLNFSKLIQSRTSKRSFLKQEIPNQIIKEILEEARFTPSGGNTQPWIVYSLTGKSLSNLSNELIRKLNSGEQPQPDLQYYPLTWKNPYKLRRIETGKHMYEKLGINRKDSEIRKKMWHDNYRWFGGQNLFLVFLDDNMTKDSFGAILDTGAFMQSLLLSIHSKGLGACPQGAVAEYSHIVKEQLGLKDSNLKLMYSVSFGYINEKEIINNFSPKKLEVEEFTTFLN